MFTLRIINRQLPSCLQFSDSETDLMDQADKLRNQGFHSLGYFLKGLSYCKQGLAYNSAFNFYDWIWSKEANSNVVYIKPPNSFYGKPTQDTLPQIALSYPESYGDPPQKRVQILWDMMEVYSDIHDHCDFAKDLMESCILALAKYYGKIKQPEIILPWIARGQVKAGWTTGKVSHLKAAKQALEMMVEGKTIPAHLVKFAGDDNGYLFRKFCANPFTRFDICHDDPYPVVRVCCNHWLPVVIGDLSQSVDEILNSRLAKDIRKSIVDGTFKYCDHLNCQMMNTNQLPNKESITDPVQRRAIHEGIFSVKNVSEVLLGIDETCNLACPSCRANMIGLKKGKTFDKIMKATDKVIIPLLTQAKSLLINPAGEVMVSKPSRRVLESLNRKKNPDLVVNLITNGTHLSESEWRKFPGIHDMIGYIRVSLDSCKQETFEKLRWPAKFMETMQNVAFLARLHREKVFEGLFFSFTYQVENFREMPDFVKFTKDHGGNGVLFERLMNMAAYTDDVYRSKAIHMLDHPLHQEFLEVLRHPIMRDEIVMGDVPGLIEQELSATEH